MINAINEYSVSNQKVNKNDSTDYSPVLQKTIDIDINDYPLSTY